MNILLLSLVLIQNPNWEKASHITISAMNISQFADLSTSMYAFGKGNFKEANPLLKSFQDSPIKMALVKGGISTLLSLYLVKMHKKHPKLVTITSSVIAIGTGYVAYRNSKLIKDIK